MGAAKRTVKDENITKVRGRYCYVNHLDRIVTPSFGSIEELKRYITAKDAGRLNKLAAEATYRNLYEKTDSQRKLVEKYRRVIKFCEAYNEGKTAEEKVYPWQCVRHRKDGAFTESRKPRFLGAESHYEFCTAIAAGIPVFGDVQEAILNEALAGVYGDREIDYADQLFATLFANSGMEVLLQLQSTDRLARHKDKMKVEDEREQLNLQYWTRTVPMVRQYNEENKCDVKPWDCVRVKGIESPLSGHPAFGSIGEYHIAVALVYDYETETHRPVHVGDVLYDKRNGTKLVTEGDQWRMADGSAWCLAMGNAKLLSWQPPKPKREFEVNGEKLPCPVPRWSPRSAQLRIDGTLYCFNSSEDRDVVRTAINKILLDARNKD